MSNAWGPMMRIDQSRKHKSFKEKIMGSSCLNKGENISQESGGFQDFFKCWISEQSQHLDDLVVVASNAAQSKGDTTDQVLLTSLVEKVMKHYEQYYNAKFQWAKQEVLAMMSPPWRSSLEKAFFWIGGWRPSMAFHLLYSKSGLHSEACFNELIRALSFQNANADASDLSQCQLTMLDELQRRILEEEKTITENMAKLQETLADNPLVELSHLATEMMKEMHEGGNENDDHMDERVESALASKEEGLENILHKADDLRMTTLRNIAEILSPLQTVHFLIAAAELHLRIHDWGIRKDALSK